MKGQANSNNWIAKYMGILFCLLLSACTFHDLAPVVERSSGQEQYAQERPGTYRVRAGDTLFGIAFSYGLDQRSLAAWNNITEPYTIYPDQVLRLTEPSQGSADSGEVRIYKAAAPQTTTTRTYTTRDTPVTGAHQKPVPPAPSNRPSATPTDSASTRSSPSESTSIGATHTPAAQTPSANTQKPVPAATSPDKPPATSAASPTTAAGRSVVPQSHADPSSWMWPTSGPVLRGFVAGDPARNGVDIAGKEGQEIRATAAGTVAYSGNGLIGYGELIIIKHSDNMLSAYAHNKTRLVEEGQQLAAGEKIAEMGRNDRNEQILHFEIRVRGKPVNPLTYLPSR